MTVSKEPAKAAAKGGDWDYLTLRKASNGFIITKGFDWKPGAKKQPEEPKPYVAATPEDADMYVDHCLGIKEPAEKKGY